MELASRLFELLWIGALAAVPLSLIAAGICRWARCRPATRHAIWAAVLASFVLPFLAAALWRPVWVEAGQAWRLVSVTAERGRELMGNARWGVRLASNVLFPRGDGIQEAGTGTRGERVGAASTTKPGTRRVEDVTGAASDRNGSRGERSTPARECADALTPRQKTCSDLVAQTCAETPSATQCGDIGSERVAFLADYAVVPGDSATASYGSVDSGLNFAGQTEVQVGTFAARPRGMSEVGIRAFGSQTRGAPSFRSPERSTVTNLPRRLGSGPSSIRDDRAAANRGSELAGAGAAGIPTEPSVALSGGSGWTTGRIPGWASHWFSAFPSVRSAMSDLPPLPVSLWTSGLVALVALSGWRTWRLMRLVERGTRPTHSTVDLVSECAERIGLSRVPETVMVPVSVSPLVWCGGRVRLVLPETLWARLDSAARRAVVMHELAHLRRMDHRLCWFVGLIGALYWWHPVAWWAQRRLRDEADLSCDAWVTTLLPGSRRAYAEVLLATGVFLSEGAGAGLGGPQPRVVSGLSMVSGMSGRSKRMARRLTMVMKERVAPRASVMGMLAAIGIAAAGTFVTPGLACPPEKASSGSSSAGPARGQVWVVTNGAKARKAEAEKEAQAARANAASADAFMGEAPALEAMRGGGESHARHSAQAAAEGAAVGGGDSMGGLEARLAELEARLERLHARAADRAAVSAGGLSGQLRSRVEATQPRHGLAVLVPGHYGQAAVTLPRTPIAPIAPVPPSEPMRALGSFTPMAPMTAPAPGTTPRAYVLPKGKLQALIGLMERQDVPIFIERHSDKIVVHATLEQHEIFGAFVRLINPEQSEALSPDRVPAAAESPLMRSGSARPRVGPAKVEEYRRALERFERSREQLERRMEQSRERSESVREKGENLREISERLREQATNEEHDAERANLEGKASEIAARADAIQAEADALAAQADEMEGQIDELASAAEELDGQIDEVEAEADVSMTSDEAPITEESDTVPESESESATPQTMVTPRPSIAESPVMIIAPASISAGSSPVTTSNH